MMMMMMMMFDLFPLHTCTTKDLKDARGRQKACHLQMWTGVSPNA